MVAEPAIWPWFHAATAATQNTPGGRVEEGPLMNNMSGSEEPTSAAEHIRALSAAVARLAEAVALDRTIKLQVPGLHPAGSEARLRESPHVRRREGDISAVGDDAGGIARGWPRTGACLGLCGEAGCGGGKEDVWRVPAHPGIQLGPGEVARQLNTVLLNHTAG